MGGRSDSCPAESATVMMNPTTSEPAIIRIFREGESFGICNRANAMKFLRLSHKITHQAPSMHRGPEGRYKQPIIGILYQGYIIPLDRQKTAY